MFHRFHRCLASLAVLLAAGAQAQGLYAGAGLSAPNFSSRINGIGGGDGGSGPGFKLYAGYPLTRGFALEGGYFDLGRSRDVGGRAKGHGLYIDGVGRWDWAPQWSLLGSVGAAEAQLQTPAARDSSPAIKFGIGLQYDISRTVALRLSYDWYHFANAFGGKPDVGQTVLGIRGSF